MTIIASMRANSIPVSQYRLGDVVQSFLKGNERHVGDSSLAFGFTLAAGMFRSPALDARSYNALLGKLIEDDALEEAEWLLADMAAANLTPDSMRLAQLAISSDVRDRPDQSAVYRDLLQMHGDANGVHSPTGAALQLGGFGNRMDTLLSAVASAQRGTASPEPDAFGIVVTALLRCNPCPISTTLRLLNKMLEQELLPPIGSCYALLKIALKQANEESKEASLNDLSAVIDYLDSACIQFDSPAGRSLFLSALGRCGLTNRIAMSVRAAIADNVADQSFCNTALSQCLFARDWDTVDVVTSHLQSIDCWSSDHL